MADTGSLIQVHYHNNFKTLENLSDFNGILYYKEVPISLFVSDEEIQQAILDTLKVLKEED